MRSARQPLLQGLHIQVVCLELRNLNGWRIGPATRILRPKRSLRKRREGSQADGRKRCKAVWGDKSLIHHNSFDSIQQFNRESPSLRLGEDRSVFLQQFKLLPSRSWKFKGPSLKLSTKARLNSGASCITCWLRRCKFFRTSRKSRSCTRRSL